MKICVKETFKRNYFLRLRGFFNLEIRTLQSRKSGFTVILVNLVLLVAFDDVVNPKT